LREDQALRQKAQEKEQARKKGKENKNLREEEALRKKAKAKDQARQKEKEKNLR